MTDARKALADANRKDAQEFCEDAFGPFVTDVSQYVEIVAELMQHATDRARSPLPGTREEVARLNTIAAIIEKHITRLDIGCGDEYRIPDAIAEARQEESTANANDIIENLACWTAAAILALPPAPMPERDWPETVITNPDIPNPTGVPYIDGLIHRLLDAQQDIKLEANESMSQPLCDASALCDEIETALRTAARQKPMPEREGMHDALKNAHEEIVLTIAFLARDITTERLSKTIEHLTTRLVAVDKVCRAALAPHDKTEG